MGPVFWATALGGYRSQDGSDDEAGFRNSLGGVMFGLEGEVSDHWRGGGFIGGGRRLGPRRRLDPRHRLQQLLRRRLSRLCVGPELRRSFALRRLHAPEQRPPHRQQHGAGRHRDRARQVSTASIVSPSVTVGTHMAMGDTIVVPSLRLRYAGLFLDGYSERGGERRADGGFAQRAMCSRHAARSPLPLTP